MHLSVRSEEQCTLYSMVLPEENTAMVQSSYTKLP